MPAPAPVERAAVRVRCLAVTHCSARPRPSPVCPSVCPCTMPTGAHASCGVRATRSTVHTRRTAVSLTHASHAPSGVARRGSYTRRLHVLAHIWAAVLRHRALSRGSAQYLHITTSRGPIRTERSAARSGARARCRGNARASTRSPRLLAPLSDDRERRPRGGWGGGALSLHLQREG